MRDERHRPEVGGRQHGVWPPAWSPECKRQRRQGCKPRWQGICTTAQGPLQTIPALLPDATLTPPAHLHTTSACRGSCSASCCSVASAYSCALGSAWAALLLLPLLLLQPPVSAPCLFCSSLTSSGTLPQPTTCGGVGAGEHGVTHLDAPTWGGMLACTCVRQPMRQSLLPSPPASHLVPPAPAHDNSPAPPYPPTPPYRTWKCVSGLLLAMTESTQAACSMTGVLPDLSSPTSTSRTLSAFSAVCVGTDCGGAQGGHGAGGGAALGDALILAWRMNIVGHWRRL